jgi:hypothetical protein
MEWQPIETAPRDGTSVLLYLPGTRIRVGCWRDRGSDGPGWGNPTESGELGDSGLTNTLDAAAEATCLSGRLARQRCPLGRTGQYVFGA